MSATTQLLLAYLRLWASVGVIMSAILGGL